MNRQAVASALGGGGKRAPAGGGSFLAALDTAGMSFGLPEGYTTRDNGRGTNEILDASGAVIGTGYDDLDTTLKEWQRENVMGSAKEREFTSQQPWVNPLGEMFGDQGLPTPPDTTVTKKALYSPYLYDNVPDTNPAPGSTQYLANEQRAMMGAPSMPGNTLQVKQFTDRAELDKALEARLAASPSIDDLYGAQHAAGVSTGFFSNANRWEAIGKLAKGLPEDNGVGSAMLGGLPEITRGGSIDDPEVDQVTGQNALYGSTPIFKGGKLVGYKVDPRLMTAEDQKAMAGYYSKLESPLWKGEATDMSVATERNRRNSATSNTMSRELNPGWDQFGKVDESSYFIPVDKINEAPGWKNSSMASYEKWGGGGSFFSKILGNPAALIGIALAFTGIPLALGNLLVPTALAGTTGAAMAGSAVIGGVTAKLSGGDFVKGALTAGLTAGVGDYLGGGSFTEALTGSARAANAFAPFGAGATAANAAARGALTGVAGAALRGGNIGAGAFTGAVSGGVFPGNGIGDIAGRVGTGLLANRLFSDQPQSNESVTNAVTQATASQQQPNQWATIGNSDVSNMTARQRIADAIKSRSN